MDIAQSIDFDGLNKNVTSPPPVPMKDFPADKRDFDRLYPTNSNSFAAEAPPVYQEDLDRPKTSKSSSSSKFILKTVAHTFDRPMDRPVKHIRNSSEGRKSLQAPKIEPAPTNLNRLQSESIQDAHGWPSNPTETMVLYETTSTSMDFTQRDESMPGRMGLIKGASTCIVRIISRRKYTPVTGLRTVRSIWTIANDGKFLPHGIDIIPYTLWSNQKKVIIRHPTDLRYYHGARSESPYKSMETSWVTYSFSSESESSDFQSTLLSPLQLVKSFPTSRTMRLHPSPFVRAFSPRLQLCGLENLRVFRDANDPNCLLCMIHYSPNFCPSNGEEYIVFKLYPPPRISVRIREDGESCVKIKGLDIRGYPAGEQAKKFKTSQTAVERLEEEAYGTHSIEKIKIEFESGKEKREFLEMTRELQGLSSW
ncbi:MAG: hypothetical protein Q9186_000142 [Xanthomendoza sp. 1 TL-2023]